METETPSPSPVKTQYGELVPAISGFVEEFEFKGHRVTVWKAFDEWCPYQAFRCETPLGVGTLTGGEEEKSQGGFLTYQGPAFSAERGEDVSERYKASTIETMKNMLDHNW